MDQEITIKKTKSAPFVNLSTKNSIIKIKGSSFSEEIGEIYDNISKWIELNINNIESKLNVEIALYVFNSLSHKRLLSIFKDFYELNIKNIPIEYDWYVYTDDEDTLEFIKDLENLFNISITIHYSDNKADY